MILAAFQLDERNLTRIDVRVNPAKSTCSGHIEISLLNLRMKE